MFQHIRATLCYKAYISRWPSFQHFFADWKTVSLNFELKGQLFSWKLFLRPNIYFLSKYNLNLYHVFYVQLYEWIKTKSCMSLKLGLFICGFFYFSSPDQIKPNQSKIWGYPATLSHTLFIPNIALVSSVVNTQSWLIC